MLDIGGGLSGKDFPVTFQEVKKSPVDKGGCSGGGGGARVQLSLFVFCPPSFQTSSTERSTNISHRTAECR